MALQTKVGAPTPLVAILTDGNELQHPQAEIYAPGGTSPIATLDLLHKAKGRYEAPWTPTAPGLFLVHYFVYSDAAHTIRNVSYNNEGEQVSVTTVSLDDLAESTARLLGLSKENMFVDKTEFDTIGQLLSCRIRLFDSEANASTAQDGDSYSTGLIATYTMTAEHEGTGKLKTFRYVRDS
jgi:hypothetical protein